MLNLELRHLRMVRTIDQMGTLTKAAQELGVTQSAVSQQLLDLEERLGMPLFERTRPRLKLTDVGQGFLERAMPVLRELAVAEAHVQQLVSGESGVLRVSSDSMLCFPWLPGVVGRFRRLHPGVRVHVGQQENVLRAVSKKKLDVGLTYPREVPPELELIPLFDDEMLVVLPPGHTLASKPKIAITDFSGSDLIYHMELTESVLYKKYLKPRNIELGSFTRIDQSDAVLAMVRAGLGITLLPRWSAQRDEADGSVVTRPLRGRQGFHVHWSAVIRRESSPSYIREFVEGVRDEAASR